MNCTRSSGDARRENVAASRNAMRPVREAAGRVVRADDQARTNDERAVAERVLHDPLARCLAGAVRLGVVRRFGAGIELGEGGVLDRRHGLVGVGRDARDEHVAAGALAQRLGRTASLVGEVRRDVEHRVPLAPGERRQVGRPIASQLLDLREEIGARAPAVEERRLVTLLEQRIDERTAEEARPAENERLHPG